MSQLENYLMDKVADVSGTNVMPAGAPTYLDRDRNPTKTIPKVGEALTQNEGVSGEQFQKLPQAAPLKLRVDTTGKEAPSAPTTKESQYWGLPAFRRYPLDSYAHVKTAASYYDDNYKAFAPALRREYCHNLCKRASMLGIEVSDEVRKYGAEGYASAAEIDIALSGREGVVKEAAHLQVLQDLREGRHRMLPEDFALVLGEFDKVAGIDHLYDQHVLDPYYSTYGVKQAEDEGALLAGNDYISQAELERFARTCSGKLHDIFGGDFVKEFRKDPVAITKSLPTDQRKMVIRLAASSLTDPTTT